jgi:hypothetical protein
MVMVMVRVVLIGGIFRARSIGQAGPQNVSLIMDTPA